METTTIVQDDIFGNRVMDRSQQCDEGNFYIQSTLFKTVIGSHVLCSALALITNLWFLHIGFRKVYFHRNVKIIMAFSITSNIVHSIFTIILQGSHLYLYVSAKTGCDVIVPIAMCLALRQPMNISMMSFVPLNVTIVIERAIATIRVNSYEKCSSFFGLYLGILAMFTSLLLIFGSQFYTPTSGSELYCSAVNKFTQDGVTVSSYFAMALEMAAIVVFFVIWWANSQKRTRLIFNVTTAYQVSENLASLHLLLPWMIFHFLMFAFFNVANFTIPIFVDINANKMTLRSLYAGVYIIPLYCMLSPCMLTAIVLTQKKSRVKQLQRLSKSVADIDSYESYLQKQWY